MKQMTKTVTKIKVSPEEMQEHKEEQLNAAIQKAAAQVREAATVLLQWATDAKATSEWTFMPNKDVYYIPEIVGVMPNLRNFEATFQQCSNGNFAQPSAEQMKFSDFDGDFPTEREAEKCFTNENRYFRKNDKGETAKGILAKDGCHDGATYRTKDGFFCFNIYQGYRKEAYGRGAGNDYGWNIPIHRFRGKNSAAVSRS